jgi:hypothetical protein
MPSSEPPRTETSSTAVHHRRRGGVWHGGGLAASGAIRLLLIAVGGKAEPKKKWLQRLAVPKAGNRIGKVESGFIRGVLIAFERMPGPLMPLPLRSLAAVALPRILHSVAFNRENPLLGAENTPPLCPLAKAEGRAAQSQTANAPSSTQTTMNSSEVRSDKLVGHAVVNAQDEKVGNIDSGEPFHGALLHGSTAGRSQPPAATFT